MKIFLALIAALAASTTLPAQSGALSGSQEKLNSELLISTLSTKELTARLEQADAKIEHVSEVARNTPVAAVLRVPGCQPDAQGTCRVNVDIVVKRPDGSVYSESKALDLPKGRAAIPLKFAADAPTGVYNVIATVRDLTARRFATVERKFGVK